MEQADKDWDEILATYKALCEGPKKKSDG